MSASSFEFLHGVLLCVLMVASFFLPNEYPFVSLVNELSTTFYIELPPCRSRNVIVYPNLMVKFPH